MAAAIIALGFFITAVVTGEVIITLDLFAAAQTIMSIYQNSSTGDPHCAFFGQ